MKELISEIGIHSCLCKQLTYFEKLFSSIIRTCNEEFFFTLFNLTFILRFYVHLEGLHCRTKRLKIWTEWTLIFGMELTLHPTFTKMAIPSSWVWDFYVNISIFEARGRFFALLLQ